MPANDCGECRQPLEEWEAGFCEACHPGASQMSCETCGREIKNYGVFCGGVRCENYCDQSQETFPAPPTPAAPQPGAAQPETKMPTLKHGKNLIVFTMTDFSNAPNLPTSAAPEFIHPTIVIRQMQVQDALLEYKQWGERASLDRAERLRKVTGNTLYLSTAMSCREGEIEIGWQMNKVKGESPDFIHRYSTPYAAQIKSCGFHPSTVAILSKIVKWCEHRSGWNTPPESVVDALKSIKASSAVYDRDADEFILQDHQECDNYFGMPDDLRVETIKTTVGPVIAN